MQPGSPTDVDADARSLERLPVAGGEWVGARVPFPALVEEADPAPDLLVWVEMPDARIVGVTVSERDEPVPFVSALIAAAASPADGEPRRPPKLRVADPALAREIAETLPALEVDVAPTPEADAVIDALAAAVLGLVDDDIGYFEDGEIPEPVVAGMFRAAASLYRAAPWDALEDFHVLEVDIPELGVESGCLSVLGAQEEPRGFLLFPSFEDYEAHLDALDEIDAGEPSVDLRSPVLSLRFERRDELPARMRRETARHGWPVAAAAAYPWIEYRDRYGVAQVLAVDDVRIVVACASALPAFLDASRARLPRDAGEGVEGTFTVDDGVEVRVRAFGEDWYADDEPGEPFVRGPKIGRNDPCPCGSGLKYKKCCLPKDEAERTRSPLH